MPSEQHEGLVAALAAAPPVQATVEQSRANYEGMLSANQPPEDAVIEEITVGEANADWVSVPESLDDRAVLYLHGGGYVIGSNVGYREFAARFARATKAKVLVLNYRLAPEHPYPAAVDDSVAAYDYMLAAGLAPEKIMVAGDSAGGGLTFATLVALRDQGKPLPACATTFSPWVDLEGTGDSAVPGAVDDPMVTSETLHEMAAHYAGGDDLRNPLVSPLHANLSGLPPQLVFVGTREILRDDAIRIVDNARSAGVDASLEIGSELIHVWPVFPMPEAAESLAHVGEFADRYL